MLQPTHTSYNQGHNIIFCNLTPNLEEGVTDFQFVIVDFQIVLTLRRCANVLGFYVPSKIHSLKHAKHNLSLQHIEPHVCVGPKLLGPKHEKLSFLFLVSEDVKSAVKTPSALIVASRSFFPGPMFISSENYWNQFICKCNKRTFCNN